MEQQGKRGIRRYAPNIILFLGMIVLLVILLEIGFRLFYPQALYDECDPRNPNGPSSRVMPDPLLGHTTKPNGTWCLYQPDTNKKIIIHTNSKGLRGTTEYNYTKPPNTLRIAIMGDSFIWGENLNDTQTMSAQLQNKIQQKLNTKYQQPPTVEVIPFGAGNYDTVQLYLIYTKEAFKYQPEVVMYFFYQNDLTDSFSQQLNNYPRPSIEIMKEGLLFTSANDNVVETRKRKPNAFPLYSNPNGTRERLPWYKQFLLGNSHFFSFADRVLARMQWKKETNREELNSDVKRLWMKLSVNQRYAFEARKRVNPEFSTIVAFMELYLTTFNYDVKGNNQEFVLVNIPSVYQIKDQFIKILEDEKKDFEKKRKEANSKFEASGKLFDKKENYFLRTVSTKNNISYIDLSPVADKYQKEFYISDDHWSPRGVEVSAEYVAEQLDEQGLLKMKK